MTSSISTPYQFDRLAGASNYASWSTNVKYVLMDKGLWSVVSGILTAPVTPLDFIDNTDSKPSPEYIAWSRENDRACATIALTCLDGPKAFIKDLNARQMWIKLKELYEVRGFDARYLTLTSLLNHHYDSCKSMEDYVHQLKASAQRLKELDPMLPDWVVLTVLLNNLGSTVNSFVTAKLQSVRVASSTFDALAAELMEKASMENNKHSMGMVPWGYSSSKFKRSSSKRCTHCKKTGHEEPNCFLKYTHKKKEFEAAKSGK